MHVDGDDATPVFSTSDIERAVAEGVLPQEQADELIRWGYRRRFGDSAETPEKPPEQAKGFNLVTVAYYFGAMLMISASAWFLGDKWDSLGPAGIFTTSLVYALASATIGSWVRRLGYKVGGGLLITVAVCLVPIITYSVQAMLGLWPAGDPGAYGGFYPKIHGSWIVMEIATIAAAGIALRSVRFGFLTAPLAFAFWFLSMDVASLILRDTVLVDETRYWISVIVGIATIIVGYALDRYLKPPEHGRTEDFAFWCYLFGTLAFWGGLTAMDGDSEFNRAIYALINVGLIALAIRLKRSVFLVFGALGVHIYLGHLAFRVFEDSFFFPFVIAGLGLSLILVTVFAQRFLMRRSDENEA
ncbi:MAG: DUF2157 domain-containing protein [Pyrinomonadaceae bacterium]